MNQNGKKKKKQNAKQNLFSNSPAAGGDLQSANLDSTTEAMMRDGWRQMLVDDRGRAWCWCRATKFT